MTFSACKHKVSGSLSLPARGAFHLSFTVLLLYRSPSRRYSGYRWLLRLFAYRILTFSDWPSHVIRLNLCNTVFCPNPECITTLGLASSAFARHYLRNLSWFLFLALLRCFSSGGSPHIPMDSVYDDKTFLLPDCSIRKSTDITLTYSSP